MLWSKSKLEETWLSWRLLDQYGIHRSSTSPTKSWQTSSSSLLSCSWQAESSSEHIVATLLAQRKLLKEMAIPIIVPKPFMTQFAEDRLIVVILVLEGCAIVCYRHW